MYVNVFLQRKRDLIVSASLRHESHSPSDSQNFSKKFPSEQIVQSLKDLITGVKLDKKAKDK